MATNESIPVPAPTALELLGAAAGNVCSALLLSLPRRARPRAWRLLLAGISRLPGGGWACVIAPRDLFDGEGR